MRGRISIAIFIALVIAGTIVLATRTGTENLLEENLSATAHKAESARISRSYDDGMLTIDGELQVPTPCDTVTAAASTAASSSESSETVRVDVSVTYDTGICLLRATTAEFSVSSSASGEAEVEVYVNGELVEAITE